MATLKSLRNKLTTFYKSVTLLLHFFCERWFRPNLDKGASFPDQVEQRVSYIREAHEIWGLGECTVMTMSKGELDARQKLAKVLKKPFDKTKAMKAWLDN